MSQFRVNLDFAGRLWPEEESTYTWGSHSVSFGSFGISLSTEIDVSKEDQETLVRVRSTIPPEHTPHWGIIPANLHSTILAIEEQLRAGAAAVDEQLRKAAGAVRLPTYKFPRSPPNQTPNWSTVFWAFSDEESERLHPLFQHLDERHRAVYRRGISIPLPDAYEGRQVHLKKKQIDSIGAALVNGDQSTPPSYTLYGVAWENFENRSLSAAVVILATSIETALKWHLTQKGDNVAGYLIENSQSPPLDKLASCARKYAGLNIPKNFQKWIAELAQARNQIVHRPVKQELKPLQVARWFAVGEALLNAIQDVASDPLVGELVRVPDRFDDFPKGSRGIVLRREETYGEDGFHVWLDSGTTRRFGPDAFEILKDEQI